MTHADITDLQGLSLSVPSAAAVERFDALIDDIYYYRLGTGDRLDALLQEFPDFVLAYVLKGYSLMTEYALDAHPTARAHHDHDLVVDVLLEVARTEFPMALAYGLRS